MSTIKKTDLKKVLNTFGKINLKDLLPELHMKNGRVRQKSLNGTLVIDLDTSIIFPDDIELIFMNSDIYLSMLETMTIGDESEISFEEKNGYITIEDSSINMKFKMGIKNNLLHPFLEDSEYENIKSRILEGDNTIHVGSFILNSSDLKKIKSFSKSLRAVNLYHIFENGKSSLKIETKNDTISLKNDDMEILDPVILEKLGTTSEYQTMLDAFLLDFESDLAIETFIYGQNIIYYATTDVGEFKLTLMIRGISRDEID